METPVVRNLWSLIIIERRKRYRSPIIYGISIITTDSNGGSCSLMAMWLYGMRDFLNCGVIIQSYCILYPPMYEPVIP